MKKIYKLVCSLIIVAIIVTIVIKSINVIATDKVPNLNATIVGYEGVTKVGRKLTEINTFVGGKFSLLIQIKSDGIPEEIYQEQIEYTLKNVFININKNENFEIVKVQKADLTSNEKNLESWSQDKIDIGGIKYSTIEHNPEVYIKLTLIAKTEGKYTKDVFLDMFKLEYEDVKGNGKVIKNLELGDPSPGETKDLNINVNDVKYEPRSITFNSDKSGDNLEVPSGESISMYFNMTSGKLIAESLDNNVIRKRDLMYVIESNALEELSEDGDSTRDLLINSLEELKKEATETKVQLLIYDKTVDVKKINGKNSLSIDEAIEVLKNQKINSDGGNLAEAMMKAQALINESKDEKSVILITSNNPYYYSLRDGAMATDFDLKENNIEFHEEQAAINVELVIEKIKVVKRDTRWFSISYGEKDNQNVSDEMIKKLGGEVLENKNPTYVEFESITNQAIADVAVMETLKGAVVSEQNEGTQVTIDESSKDGVSKIFFYKWNSTTKKVSQISNRTNQENSNNLVEFNVRVTKSDIDAETEQVDLLKKIKFSSTYEILGIQKESNGIELGFGDSVMNVTPVVAYETRVGMFNGKKTEVLVDNEKGVNIDGFRKETIQYVGTGNEQTGGLTVNLALDNYFSIGILVKPNIDISIDGTEIKGENIVKDTDIKAGIDNIYRLDKEEDKFVVYSGDKLVSLIKDEENIIDDEPIYLVVINGDIKTDDKSKIGNRFRVGINIKDAREEEAYENQGVENSREVVKTFVGLNGMISAKPEHY